MGGDALHAADLGEGFEGGDQGLTAEQAGRRSHRRHLYPLLGCESMDNALLPFRAACAPAGSHLAMSMFQLMAKSEDNEDFFGDLRHLKAFLKHPSVEMRSVVLRGLVMLSETQEKVSGALSTEAALGFLGSDGRRVAVTVGPAGFEEL